MQGRGCILPGTGHVGLWSVCAGRGVGSSESCPGGVSGHPPCRGTGLWELQLWVLQGVVTAPSLPCTAPGCADLLALHLPPPPASNPASGATSCPEHQQAAGTKPLCLWHLHSAADHPGEPVSKGDEGGAAVTRRGVMPQQVMSVSSWDVGRSALLEVGRGTRKTSLRCISAQLSSPSHVHL